MKTSLLANVARLALCFGIVGVKSFDQQQPLSTGGHGSKARDPFTQEFAHLVKKGLDDWHVAGIALSIVDGDDTFAEGFGFATLPDVLATPETLWYVGSTTKAQTTAALATLIDSGNFSQLEHGWKTRIASIIRDDFVLQDDWATQHLTLEDAAGHRTGMSRHDQSIIWDPENPRGITKATVRNLRNLPMAVEPRTEFHYCNLFYTVLGHVVETLTGKWLGDVMKERIWQPLGMNSTYFDLDDALAGPNHVSQGYIWHDDVQELKPLPFVQSAVMNGAGAVISNVMDYTKWMRCLLNKERPFSEAVHAEIRKPRMAESFETIGSDYTAYSLSWFRATIYGKTVFWHSGSTLTHGALVYWFPDENYGITIFANSVTPLRQILMYKLIEDRFNIPADQRIDVQAREKKQEELTKAFMANATNILYPNRPSKPLPAPLSLEDHAGTYENAGYGTVKVSVSTHASKPEETTLVAKPLNRGWNETGRMEHVTGNWWIWWSYLPDGPNEPDQFAKTSFQIGPDGAVSALEVDMYDFADNLSQGIISFKKVA